jgi:hypothetical protein
LQSIIQELKGLRDRKPFFTQVGGTMLSKIELAIFSKSSLMTTSPTRALWTYRSMTFISARRLLYLTHSWNNTVFIDSSYEVG